MHKHELKYNHSEAVSKRFKYIKYLPVVVNHVTHVASGVAV